jgi:hypothetical protein
VAHYIVVLDYTARYCTGVVLGCTEAARYYKVVAQYYTTIAQYYTVVAQYCMVLGLE